MPPQQLWNPDRPPRRKAPINLVVCIRFSDNSAVVRLDVVHRPRGVEDGVAKDAKSVAVYSAGSRLQLILDDALAETILRGEGPLEHSELLHQVKGRIDVVLPTLKFGKGDRHAVEDHFVLKVQATVNASIRRYSRRQPSIHAPNRCNSRSCRAVRHLHQRDPWRQAFERVNLADGPYAELRNFLEQFAWNRRAQHRLLGFEGNIRGVDFHHFTGVAHFQDCVGGGTRCCLYEYVVLNRGLKSRLLYHDPISPRIQIGEVVRPSRASSRDAASSSVRAGDRDGRFRDGCTSRVGYGAVQAA